MSKIATVEDRTIWVCDAFTLPAGWWEMTISKRTDSGVLYQGQMQTCAKECAINAIQYHTSEHILLAT